MVHRPAIVSYLLTGVDNQPHKSLYIVLDFFYQATEVRLPEMENTFYDFLNYETQIMILMLLYTFPLVQISLIFDKVIDK